MTVTNQLCRHGWNPVSCDDCADPNQGEGSTTTKQAQMSVDDGTMDEMIRRASTPNLASLFKAGKAAGLITPGKEYGHTA